MADIPVPPEAAIEAAAQKIGNAMITRRSTREIALAVWPVIAAAERARIEEAAQAASFVLFRPGNGPGIGRRLDVVPLAELRALIGDQDA